MKMEAAGSGRDPSQPVQVAKMAYCDTHTPAHILQVYVVDERLRRVRYILRENTRKVTIFMGMFP